VKSTLFVALSVLFIVACGASAAGKEKPGMGTPIGSLISMDPADVDPSELPLGSVADLNQTGTPQAITDLTAWRLEIKGDVLANPLSLSYAELAAMPTVKKRVLLICPGFFADYVEWEGVPVSALLEKAKARRD